MVSGLWHHSVMHSHNSPADEWDDEQSSEANEQRSMVGFAKYDQVDCGFCSVASLPSPVLAFCRRGRALTGRWLGGCGCRLASASRSSGARQASPWTASAGIWRRHTCTFHVGSTGMGESWRGSPSHQGGTGRRCRMRCTRSCGRMGQLMQLLLSAGVGAMGHGTLATGPWALSATELDGSRQLGGSGSINPQIVQCTQISAVVSRFQGFVHWAVLSARVPCAAHGCACSCSEAQI